MIVAVADTGPLIHLDEIDALHLLSVVDEVLIPQTVYEELEAGTVPSALDYIEYEPVEAEDTGLTVELDPGETAARNALKLVGDMRTIDVSGDAFVTSRIDSGEASCVAAVREVGATFLITDDYRALPELREIVAVDVALSPIVLRALGTRGVLREEEAKTAFEMIAQGGDWLEAPIYRYARQFFD
ncbi:hypothetical protein [Salinigranum halophilum]|uniref:hypothetical protein n=1 Tax=Salinigranum halophilum TaxID=2565931 RepID=UPI0010A8678D|nr:hypothetical protein [Salinigranum halophilum]